MKLIDCDMMDELFSHVDHDGTKRCINATKLRLWAVAEKQYPIIHFALTAEWVASIEEHRGLEQWKLDRLCSPYLHAPVLMVEMEDGTHLTVDGHHRMVKLFKSKLTETTGIILPVGSWEWSILDESSQLDF